MARKSLYDPETFPTLAEGYAREGLNDEQIAAKLGISTSTFYDYLKKFVEFSEALKRGKAPIDFEIENKLFKLAMGYEYEEVVTEIKTQGTKKEHKDGTAEVIERHTKRIKKHLPPQFNAIVFLLSNRKNDKWKRNPDNFAEQENKIEEGKRDEFLSTMEQSVSIWEEEE